MKFFSISILVIILLPLTIQAALPPKPVLFIDRQTVYSKSTKLKGFAEERRKNESEKSTKMAAIDMSTKDKAKLEENRKKMAQIGKDYTERDKDITLRNNAQATKVWDVASTIMKAEGASGVIDYSGGDQKKVIDPDYDITDKVITELDR